MATKPRKRSELWQRLRAVRTHAQLTQGQMADKLTADGIKIGRAAVSLWESRDPKNRTMPDAQQILGYARVCGVPTEYLMDDGNTPDGLGAYLAQHKEHARIVAAAKPSLSHAQIEMQAQAFWSAVKFHVVAKKPDYLQSFDVGVDVAGLPRRASFMHGDGLCAFVSDGKPDFPTFLAQETANMLLIERAAHREYKKFVLVYTPEVAIPTAAKQRFEDVLGIKVLGFNSIERAAECLLSL